MQEIDLFIKFIEVIQKQSPFPNYSNQNNQKQSSVALIFSISPEYRHLLNISSSKEPLNLSEIFSKFYQSDLKSNKKNLNKFNQ